MSLTSYRAAPPRVTKIPLREAGYRLLNPVCPPRANPPFLLLFYAVSHFHALREIKHTALAWLTSVVQGPFPCGCGALRIVAWFFFCLCVPCGQPISSISMRENCWRRVE